MADNTALFSKQMANREVCDMVFIEYKTKKPFLWLDYANTSSQELTGETVYAYGGKGHPRKVAFSGERAGTLTIETQMQTPKLWEMITGGTRSTSASFVKHESATVGASSTITLAEGVSLIEGKVWVYLATDANMNTEVTVDSVADNTITVSGEGATANTAVDVFYMATVQDVYNINIKATDFPKAFTVYGDTYMKTTDDDILPYRFTAYKAVPQANMTLSFANNGDPGTITITCDLMVDDDSNMLDLTLLPDEEAQGE